MANVNAQNKAAGEALVRYQKEHGLTNQQLADKIGVSMKSTLGWKKGIRHPRTKQRQAIKAATGIDWDNALPPEAGETATQAKPKTVRRPKTQRQPAATTATATATEREMDPVMLWKLTQGDLDVSDRNTLRLVQNYVREKAKEDMLQELVNVTKQGPDAVLDFMARAGNIPTEIIVEARQRLSA